MNYFFLAILIPNLFISISNESYAVASTLFRGQLEC